MQIKRKLMYAFIAASLLLFIKPALAEDWEKFSLDLGYFIANTDTSVRLGSGLGVSVDMEDLLGLDSTDSAGRVRASWRFTDNRRHRLDFQWFGFRRDGSRTIGEDIHYKDEDGNDQVIEAGTYVESFFDFDIYQAAYSYSFFQDDRIDLAGSFGLYVMPIEFGLNATGLLNVGGSESFTAPLPVLGVRADFEITPKWYFRSGLQVFYLEIGEFSGSILQTNVAIEYLPWKHFGFGLGFDSLNIKVEADGDDYPGIDFKGEVNFHYTGLQLYAKLYF
ncbi:MAG: hypothetical protein JRD87_17625 [Deltaproteobacteria bacterium]|nr:hypothetical protein [Deltaproteobacteria bacterium]